MRPPGIEVLIANSNGFTIHLGNSEILKEVSVHIESIAKYIADMWKILLQLCVQPVSLSCLNKHFGRFIFNASN